MDAKEIIDRINNNHIIKLMDYLESPMSEKSNEKNLIFNTRACHNGDSFKLYYYPDSKAFKCWSSCGYFDNIFNFIMHVKGIDFNEAKLFIEQFFSFDNRTAIKGFYKPRETCISKSFDEIEVEILPKIDKQFIHRAYKDIPIKQWLNEYISEEAMRTFEIRYDEVTDSAVIPHFNINGGVVGIRERHFNIYTIENFGKYMPKWIGDKCYSHSLGKNLYGLHKTKGAIKKHKKVLIGESEKFVLQLESVFKDNNIGVATCGSSLSMYHMKQLIELGVVEFIICFDKEYRNESELREYEKKLYKITNELKRKGYKVTFILDDIDGLLDYKESPTDRGVLIYNQLVKNRREINID